MGDGAAYNYIAMKDAIKDSGLEEKDISNEMTGIIVGSGGPSTQNLFKSFNLGQNGGSRKVGPFMVPRTMSSTNSATLATPFKIKGVNYSITSACSTSSHCIGNAYELIQMGKQKIIFAGGGEELHWTMSILFDAMGALSSKYNSTPKVSSRAYDANRDGFVIAGGGGTIVLEEYDHAKSRGANIYAEVTGYGATSDGHDMVQPSGEGAVRCMKQAMKTMDGKIDYINSHGTSTPIGDLKELEAIKKIFPENSPYISSTKSLTGHSLGATGVHEAIYSLLMLKNNFLCGSANINELDIAAKDHNILLKTLDSVNVQNIISNSFGFGGTNATLGFSKIMLKNKKGIVFGIANDHSIAWGIAKKLSEYGAEIGITYQNNTLLKRVKPLAEKINSKLLIECDFSKKNSLKECFKKVEKDFGNIDFIIHAVAYSDKNELNGKYLNTTKDNFINTLNISCYSFTEISKQASKIMNKGGSLLTLSFYGANKVMPNYNVMGVAKAALETSVKYLSVDLGDQKIRVNAISAGPMRTLAGAAIANARDVYNFTQSNSALKRM